MYQDNVLSIRARIQIDINTSTIARKIMLYATVPHI